MGRSDNENHFEAMKIYLYSRPSPFESAVRPKTVAKSNQTFNTCRKKNAAPRMANVEEFIDGTIISRLSPHPTRTRGTFLYYHSFPVMRAFDDNFGGAREWMGAKRNFSDVKMVNYKNVKAMIKAHLGGEAKMEKVCEGAVSAKAGETIFFWDEEKLYVFLVSSFNIHFIIAKFIGHFFFIRSSLVGFCASIPLARCVVHWLVDEVEDEATEETVARSLKENALHSFHSRCGVGCDPKV